MDINVTSLAFLKIYQNELNQEPFNKHQATSLAVKANKRTFDLIIWIIKVESLTRVQSIILEYL